MADGMKQMTSGSALGLVHIGTHKTGTTSFQQWARDHEVELRENALLESYAGLFGANHSEIAMLCLRQGFETGMARRHPERDSDEWRRAAREHVRTQVERPAQSLLISSEMLSYVRTRDEVERLVELLSPRSLFVVAVLRERRTYLASWRRQLERQGIALSTDPESFAYVKSDSWLTDYEALLDAYRSVLGPGRVTAVSYEDALATDGSVIPPIMEAFGIARSCLPPWEGYRSNRTPSRSRVQTEKIRLARRYPRAWRLYKTLRGRAREGEVRG